MSYSFRAALWLYPGEAGWHFLTLPADVAEDIKKAVRTAAGISTGDEVNVRLEIQREDELHQASRSARR